MTTSEVLIRGGNLSRYLSLAEVQVFGSPQLGEQGMGTGFRAGAAREQARTRGQCQWSVGARTRLGDLSLVRCYPVPKHNTLVDILF